MKIGSICSCIGTVLSQFNIERFSSRSNIFGQYPSTSKLSVEVPGDLGGSKQAGLLQTVPAYGNVSEHYHPTQQKNPFFLTNNSLLMVPSLGPSNFILVNNRQSGNVASLNNVLTEADIMDMPTVILDKGPPETSHIVTGKFHLFRFCESI